MATPTVNAPPAANKYDRQLRLWGAAGQEKLASARVALLNASAVGSEALKNLVLPGCGSFTIIDPNRITHDDVQNNFFLNQDALGQHRATVVCDLLLELNEDVKGEAIVADPCTMPPSALLGFSLVIATQMTPQQLAPIAATLYAANVPLVVLNSLGFIGSCRIAIAEHTVLESRLSRATEDLRVAAPFPTLRAFVDAFDLSQLDDMAHAHVPWVVLLVKALDTWKAAHGGVLPSNERQNGEVRKVLSSMARRLGGGGSAGGMTAAAAAEAGTSTASEENFEEALKAVSASVRAATVLPEDVEEVLGDAALSAAPSSSWSPFWFVARAIKDFRSSEGGGHLPLSGALPDMTSTTEAYVALQGLYREKAAADAEAVRARVRGLLDASELPHSYVSDAFITAACRSPFTLKVQRLRSLASEAAHDAHHKAALAEALNEAAYEPDTAAACPVLWYLALQAADAFTSLHGGRRPGSPAAHHGSSSASLTPAQLESDVAELSRLYRQTLAQRGIAARSRGAESGSSSDSSDASMGGGAGEEASAGSTLAYSQTAALAVELCRYAGGELHVTASLLGAVGAQEAIKLLTAQFVPHDNTFVYNGVVGVSGVYSF